MSECVLVVDDEPVVRRFATRLLVDEGFGESLRRAGQPFSPEVLVAEVRRCLGGQLN